MRNCCILGILKLAKLIAMLQSNSDMALRRMEKCLNLVICISSVIIQVIRLNLHIHHNGAILLAIAFSKFQRDVIFRRQFFFHRSID